MPIWQLRGCRSPRTRSFYMLCISAFLFTVYSRVTPGSGTPQVPSGCCSLTCWRPVSLLHGPASARRAEPLRSAPHWSSTGLWGELLDESPGVKEVIRGNCACPPHKKTQKKNKTRKTTPHTFTADQARMGWRSGPVRRCALAVARPGSLLSSLVRGQAPQKMTCVFGGGLNQKSIIIIIIIIIICCWVEDTGWDPSSERPPSQPAKQQQQQQREAVRVYLSLLQRSAWPSSAPHTLSLTHSHTHTDEPIHSHPLRGGSLQCARENPHVPSPSKLGCASWSRRRPVGLGVSVGPAGLWVLQVVGVSDVAPPLVPLVSSFIVHRLHPLAN